MAATSDKMKALIDGFTNQKLNNATKIVNQDTSLDAVLAGGAGGGGAMSKALIAFEAAARQSKQVQTSTPAQVNGLSVKDRMKQFNLK